MACFTHLKRWEEAKSSFNGFSQKSPFYHHAAFLLQSQFKETATDASIQTKLKAITYDFPEMKFQTALHNGNVAFKKGDLQLAVSYFYKALGVDAHNSESYLARYNLGICYLKQKKYQKAVSTFEGLLQSIPSERSPELLYHLLFSYYQLAQTEDFFTHASGTNLDDLNAVFRKEIELMNGNILLSQDRNLEAASLFYALWENEKDLFALEQSVIALYKIKQYNRILEIVSHVLSQSDLLFIYKVKSLLGLKQFNQAQKEIDHLTRESTDVIQLQLEVWLANQHYQKIVRKVSTLLNRALAPKTRLLYYLSLGDAHFNMKDYAESKNQFYKALSLTNDALKKSLIQYNIILIAYYSKDYPSFLKETSLILSKEELIPEIRYNIVQLLVNHYQDNQQADKVDHLLQSYIAQHSFQRAKAWQKRLQLLYQNKRYEKCYSLSHQKKEETLFQRRDRLILLGYCGNETGQSRNVQELLNKELELVHGGYRDNELKFVLAKAYFILNQYQTSFSMIKSLSKNQMDKEAQFKTKLLLVDTLLQLDKPSQAGQELGDISVYRRTQYYFQALSLLAEIQVSTDKKDEAVRSLLRIHFSKSLSEEVRQENLLRICEILIQNQNQADAQKYFAQIKPKLIKSNQEFWTRFQTLSLKINK